MFLAPVRGFLFGYYIFTTPFLTLKTYTLPSIFTLYWVSRLIGRFIAYTSPQDTRLKDRPPKISNKKAPQPIHRGALALSSLFFLW